MSSDQPAPALLNKAKQQENEYDWLGATESYGRALGSVPEQDYAKTGRFAELLAYAFYRAAMQANNPQEFRERLEQAVAGYERARRSYGKSDEPGRTPRTQRCQAMQALVGYWLAPDAH